MQNRKWRFYLSVKDELIVAYICVIIQVCDGLALKPAKLLFQEEDLMTGVRYP